MSAAEAGYLLAGMLGVGVTRPGRLPAGRPAASA